MALLSRTIPTPFGELAVVVDTGIPAVVASSFDPPAKPDAPAGEDPFLDEVEAAVRGWADGADLQALGTVPLQVPGHGFRSRAWQALHHVPAGSVVTYGGLAELAGRPAAARAAGTACATNPLAPFIPCHRVVPAGGGVGQYGYTPAVKRAMLAHEGAVVARS